MPLYEYICQDCQTKFELRRSFSQADEPVKCINCQSSHTKKLISSFICLNSVGSGSASSLGSYSCPTGTCPFSRT